MDEIGFRLMVAPVKLHKIPYDRVVYDVERKDLPVESFFLEDNEKNQEIGEIEEGLIQLSGMKRGTSGNSRQV